MSAMTPRARRASSSILRMGFSRSTLPLPAALTACLPVIFNRDGAARGFLEASRDALAGLILLGFRPRRAGAMRNHGPTGQAKFVSNSRRIVGPGLSGEQELAAS